MKWAAVKVCLEWELPDSAGSRVRMEHGWKHSSWHRSKWLILHLLLSRMSCTPSIIAITASWPTFTSADTAACRCRHSMCVFALLTLKRKPSGYPILYIKWRSVEMHTAAQLQVPFCSTVTLHAHIWFHWCSKRLNLIKLQLKRLVSTWRTLCFVLALNTIYSRMRGQGRRPRSARTPLPVS